MKIKFRSIIICMIVFLSLTACTSNEDTTNSGNNSGSSEEKEKEQVDESQDNNQAKDVKPEKTKVQLEDFPSVPATLEESVNYPSVGNFAGVKFSEQKEEITETLVQFPQLTVESSTEEIEYAKQYLWSLFKENMTMADVPIDQWESMTFTDPTGEEDEIKAKENYNVALLLDSSGSMGNYENDRTRMDLAKEAIQQFVETLPETTNVSLYVYGHVGSGSDADKAKSCTTIDEVYPLSNYNADEFSNALNQFEPAGWTPMAAAIKQVQENFKQLNATQNSNVIYIVSDGVETCNDDPVKAIKSLADSDIDPVINIIGYQVDNEGLAQLEEMAKASDGRYVNATSQEDIMVEFEQTVDMAGLWADWHNDAQRNISELYNMISKQISDWYNEEQRKLTREYNNLSKAISYLRNRDIIDADIYNEFIGSLNDSNSAIKGEIIDTLNEIQGTNIDELWETREDVIERFNNR
ncbi:vWA domain-containing protein [Paucisalibacillus globulus]|uniref:vWA domain-containing protein n=1 Tax=Paucisalibacillus globulus TaxID=351095 RepID=UPI00042534C1|nr:VWA domain-containing protein [Paucisalibacillus globulus]